jgi:hypothetical protein
MSDGMALLLIGVPATALLAVWLWVHTWAQKRVAAYIARYKKEVVARIVTFVDERLRYDPDRCVSESVYKASGLFPRACDRYAGDDYVEGQLGATPVVFSELYTAYKTTKTTMNNRTKEVWHTIFRGLFFKCEFNKTFQGRTYVLPDRLEKVLGDIGAALQRERTVYGEQVRLEDPEFERLFSVYSSDQVLARYILSTSLMARLTAFQQRTRQEMRLAFVDSNLYVSVRYKRPLFEPRIWRTLMNYQEHCFFFEAIQLVASLVDELNLNTRIWGERALQR